MAALTIVGESSTESMLPEMSANRQTRGQPLFVFDFRCLVPRQYRRLGNKLQSFTRGRIDSHTCNPTEKLSSIVDSYYM